MDDFEKQVTDRVVSALKERGIRQVELLSLCNSVGMPISQPDASKIYSGKKALSLYQFVAVCKVLEVPMDFFVWGENGSRDDFCNPHDSGNLHDSGDELKCYEGQYCLYYLSTARGEEKILKGILDVTEEKGFCQLRLELDTGEDDRQGIRIRKIYEGRILVSSALGAAYLIFKNESIGEMCMICLRHRNYSVKDMECRIGLALTMSAGEMKEPTAHRCVIMRDFLGEEQLQKLRPWLNLIDDSICIENNLLERILREAKEEYPDYVTQFDRVYNSASSKDMRELSLEVLRKQLPLDRNELVGLLTQLYDKADVIKNYKISQLEDVNFFDTVNAVREAKMTVEANNVDPSN